jgi:iron complex outermembrane receptor protein
MNKTHLRPKVLATAIAALLSASIASGQETSEVNERLEEVLVVSKTTTYANTEINDSMKLQNSSITSINNLIDNLPGVTVHEGDAFGFDDWSTAITVRGFQTNLGEQQVGSTIDGLPNGNSNYGGGAKANRYIDTANLETIEVAQGTADISSRSLESLGGTLNYVTSNPLSEERVRVEYVTGQYDATRYYARYDSGDLGSTRFFVSASHQEATDWMEGSAQNERDHLAGKLVSELERVTFTAYLSYDEIHEDNYQRVYSKADYIEYPNWDQLIGTWTDTPYTNQSYRRGWSTLRENLFSYGRLEWNVSDSIEVNAAVYYHDNKGRGDWIPPYLVDVVADGAGASESEFTGTRVLGGSALGTIFFVDGNGVALSPEAGCVSSITFPYGGAGAVYDPACYPANAIPVQSYRHTHYQKERFGFTADLSWDTSENNTIRAGVWYEDGEREEYRDWHKLTDARIGIEFENPAYWVQYSRSYPQDVLKWYVEDGLEVGALTLNIGANQYLVEVSRKDIFGASTDTKLDSDSDVLLSAGFVYDTNITGLSLFGGYSENFKSISDNILERESADLGNIKPETSDVFEAGLRYAGDQVYATATYFDSQFDNRIIFLAPGSAAGNDYLIGTNGAYFNAGGIDSSGLELAATYNIDSNWSVYGSFTSLDSVYKGSGNSDVDAENGIFAGNDVTGIPETMWVVSVDYTSETYTAGISAKTTGERAVNTANTWYTDEYTLVDAYLSVSGERLSSSLKGFRLHAQVFNLADERYEGVVSSNAIWLGAPRTATIGLTFDF